MFTQSFTEASSLVTIAHYSNSSRDERTDDRAPSSGNDEVEYSEAEGTV
jgi:hypothetical protein